MKIPAKAVCRACQWTEISRYLASHCPSCGEVMEERIEDCREEKEAITSVFSGNQT